MSFDPIGADPAKPTAALAETFRRANGSFANTTGMTSGTLYLTAIALAGGLSVSTITFFTSTTPVGTPTHQWFCLLDSSLNVLAKTADDTTTAWGSSTAKTLTISGGPYVTTRSGLYYVGVLVTATTPPGLMGLTDTDSNADALAPAICGTSTTGLTDPASLGATAAAITAGLRKRYAYVA